MKRRPERTAPILGIAVAFLLLASPVTATETMNASYAKERPAGFWKTVASSGPVEALPATVLNDTAVAWDRVRRGDELAPTSTVRTGRRGRATLTRGSSILIIDPKSQLELPASGVDGMETSVIQTAGSVLYEIEGKKNPHFSVVTPTLVAGVKGTSFLVTVNDRYTSVTVEHGLVEITDSRTGERMDLHAGEAVIHDLVDSEIEVVGRSERGEVRAAQLEGKRLARFDSSRRDPQLVRPWPSDSNPLLRTEASDRNTKDDDDSSRGADDGSALGMDSRADMDDDSSDGDSGDDTEQDVTHDDGRNRRTDMFDDDSSEQDPVDPGGLIGDDDSGGGGGSVFDPSGIDEDGMRGKHKDRENGQGGDQP